MTILLRYLELLLTLAGLAVIFGVSAIIAPSGTTTWQVAAITATLVGVVHGVLFWAIRQRQRAMRLQTVREVQSMLKDIINNQLTIIQGMNHLRSEDPSQTQRATDQISRCVTSISDALQHLSEESLQTWRNKYTRRPAPAP